MRFRRSLCVCHRLPLSLSMSRISAKNPAKAHEEPFFVFFGVRRRQKPTYSHSSRRKKRNARRREQSNPMRGKKREMLKLCFTLLSFTERKREAQSQRHFHAQPTKAKQKTQSFGKPRPKPAAASVCPQDRPTDRPPAFGPRQVFLSLLPQKHQRELYYCTISPTAAARFEREKVRKTQKKGKKSKKVFASFDLFSKNIGKV